MSDKTKFEKGARVWHAAFGNGIVESNDNKLGYPIGVIFKKNDRFSYFMSDGKFNRYDEFPSLFIRTEECDYTMLDSHIAKVGRQHTIDFLDDCEYSALDFIEVLRRIEEKDDGDMEVGNEFLWAFRKMVDEVQEYIKDDLGDMQECER